MKPVLANSYFGRVTIGREANRAGAAAVRPGSFRNAPLAEDSQLRGHR